MANQKLEQCPAHETRRCLRSHYRPRSLGLRARPTAYVTFRFCLGSLSTLVWDCVVQVGAYSEHSPADPHHPKDRNPESTWLVLSVSLHSKGARGAESSTRARDFRGFCSTQTDQYHLGSPQKASQASLRTSQNARR